MAEHVEQSPGSSPPRAPSLDKSPTASRKVTPTQSEATPLPSPPESLERARPAGVALPEVLVEVLREWNPRPFDPDFYKTVPLSRDEYKSAREVIEKTFRRFDYDPFKGKITIRMNSPIHDRFAGLVNSAVTVKLIKLRDGDSPTANFARSIMPFLSARNELDNRKRPALPVQDPEKKEHKLPDLQFCHKMANHSGTVVEIAYSQPAKELKKLAVKYIGGTLGQIQNVIGFDLNTHKESTVSLDVHQVLEEVPFRSADREPLNQDSELPLFLHDMTTDKSLLEGVDNLSISLLFKDLCVFLDEVENHHELCCEPKKKRLINGLPIKSMPPSSSPEEELASEDERVFAEQEEAEQKKATRSDCSFSRPVGEDIKGSPSVTTRSSSKRRAPANTGENLPVPKRRRGRE
ncbi:hypothetical protein FCIRC_8006 [Fusarium circinatum]|uniref:Uncharacterized protein n=1 Tax=Fusarium circinatum TaxID=48490 RepID=A0A8H5TQB3_FUSCI|nr:hypothetical protein FCIRC_8006 [Fusarium circinatum]